jgi:hypothetical protein
MLNAERQKEKSMKLEYAGFAVNHDKDLVPLMINVNRKDAVELYFIENDGVIRMIELRGVDTELRPITLFGRDTLRLSRLISKHKEKFDKACIIYSPVCVSVTSLDAMNILVFFNDEDGGRDVFKTMHYMSYWGEEASRDCSFDCTDLHHGVDDSYDSTFEAFGGYAVYTIIQLLKHEIARVLSAKYLRGYEQGDDTIGNMIVRLATGEL